MAPQSPRRSISALPARRRWPAPFAGLRCEQLEDRLAPALFNVQQPLSFTGLNNNGFVGVTDFDKDGSMDAVLTNFGTNHGSGAGNSITILYGRQGGGFTRVQLNTGGTNVSFASIADINGDSWPDVVVSNANQQNTGSVSVFRNDGTGLLSQVGSPFSTFGNNSDWVGLADVTGEGVLDVIVASFGKANGNESVTGQNVTIFQGNADAQGKGNFTFSGSPVTTLAPEIQFIPTALAVADFDGDGLRDIAAAVPGVPPDFDQPQPNGSVYLFKGTGSGGFAAPSLFDTGGALPVNIQAADLNGDGKLDLVIANAGDPNANPEFSNDSVGLLINASSNGSLNFNVRPSLGANTYGTFAVAAADFNLDGKMDIASINYGAQLLGSPAFVSIYQGNGTGVFTPGSPGMYDTQTNLGGGQYLAVGDFDANGSPDLIVAHATNRVGMLLNTTAAAVPPKITGATINGGAAQRSMVSQLDLTFDQAVVLPANPSAAFQLARLGPNAPTGNVTLTVTVMSPTSVRLTFGGSLSENGSLVDGNYALTVFGNQVQTSGGLALDGDNNGTPGGDYSLSLHRLFGDSNGDRAVNAADLNLFRIALGGTIDMMFDFNGDGVINAADLNQFRLRLGAGLP